MGLLYKAEKYIVFVVDIILLFVAYSVSLTLMKAVGYPISTDGIYNSGIVVMALITAASAIIFKVYENPIGNMGVIDALRLGIALVVAYVTFFIVESFFVRSIPVIVLANTMMIHLILCCGYRFSIRLAKWMYGYYISPSINKDKGVRRVVIVGAGDSGRYLGNSLSYDSAKGMHVVAYIDDDDKLWNKKINGIPVVGGRELLPYTTRKFSATDIIIAVPRVDGSNIRDIFEYCCKTTCKVSRYGEIRTLSGNALKPQILDFKIEDLLGRPVVKLDMELAKGIIAGRTIIVTGGAGSIGSEICRQVLDYGAKQLIVFDFDENALFDIKNELLENFDERRFVIVLGSIRDTGRLKEVFMQYKPDIVLHAAAHKHVPMMESNPIEAINNNVFGTINTAKVAVENGVKRFVLISTDKAVNPTNIMGASKRIAELVVQTANKWSDTMFTAVRFGNVLGSNGSVVPLFKKQIENGGPVTVTHKEVKRYFMTIPEAVQLVLQAGAMAKGGEIFVLDMGQPIKIYDLACAMIRLSGFTPERDIKIKITGLRPGEKLFEEISLTDENVSKTSNDRIYLLKAEAPDNELLSEHIRKMQKIVMTRDIVGLRRIIREVVPTYNTKGETTLRLAWSREGS